MKSLIVLLLLLESVVCFNKMPKPDGIPISRGEFPFYVQLCDTSKYSTYPVPICGGSLISSEFVLTTAYCLQILKLDYTQVYAGTAKILGDDAVLNSIVNFTLHPEYIRPPHPSKLWALRNNIGVARLKHRYEGVKFVSPIQILSARPQCITGITVGLGNMYCYHKPFKPCFEVKYKRIKTKTHDEVEGFNLKNFPRRNVFFYEESPPEWGFRWGYRDYGAPFVCYFGKKAVQYGLLSNKRSNYRNYTVRNYTVSVYESLDDHAWFLAKFLPHLKSFGLQQDGIRKSKFQRSKSSFNLSNQLLQLLFVSHAILFSFNIIS